MSAYSNQSAYVTGQLIHIVAMIIIGTISMDRWPKLVKLFFFVFTKNSICEILKRLH